MTIIYRNNDPVSGRWTGIGTNLSAFQGDSNLFEIISRITALESGAGFNVGISYITQDPSTGAFTFHMTDHTVQGPFPVPLSTLHPVTWMPSTALSVNDTFDENGVLYLVIYPHITQSSFSPSANDGAGHNYYAPLLTLPGNSLPAGGAVGQVLKKTSTSDFSVAFGDALPTGGTTAQILTKNSNTNQDVSWKNPAGVSAPPPSPGGAPGQVLATLDGTSTNTEWVYQTSGVAAPPPSPAGVAGQVLATVDGTADNTEWLVVQAHDPQLFSNIPQNLQLSDYITILTDGEKHIFHPAVDTTARTWTIDSNANVAYPIGTAITFVNQNGAGIITIAITSDIMRLAGAGTTGSRTLAANGVATALKITTTEWLISGTGLT